MQVFTALVAVAALQTVACHSVFTTFFVDDVNQGDGTCIRMPKDPDTCTSPIIDLTSNDMACGFNGDTCVARVCPVAQGAKLSFLWREWADGSQPGAIDISHKGPCSVYMKAVASSIVDHGYGDGWFKIWDEGYNMVTSQWCTEKLIANNGLFSVNIPADIAGGYYLVRPELLALQEADKSPPQPQFYTGCAQIFLQSSGIAVSASTVSIPGYLNAGDPSVNFNIYTPKFPYPVPGPAAYQSNQGGATVKVTTGFQIQSEGLKPDGCILVNANWCGIEVDSYSDEAGCWNASQACWSQASSCYDMSPPTGSKNCAIWETKCTNIQNECNNKNFNGPPNKGKDLNPTNTIIYVIPVADTAPITNFVVAGLSISTGPASLVTDTFQREQSTDPTTTGSHTAALLSMTVGTTSCPDNTISHSVPTPLSTINTDSTSTLTATTTLYRSVTSSSVSALYAGSANSNTIKVSDDATCGEDVRTTCSGSGFGDCCSQWGWCGVTAPYCGMGCQSGFGLCWTLLPEKDHKVQARHMHRRLGHHREH